MDDSLIDEGYRLFAPYRVGDRLTVSDRVSDQEQAELLRTPLRSVTGDQLRRGLMVSPSAGRDGVREQKHFLPRMAELLLAGDDSFAVVPDYALRRLYLSEHADLWPDDERDWLARLGAADLRSVLASPPADGREARDVIVRYANAGLDHRSLLSQWSADWTVTALRHLGIMLSTFAAFDPDTGELADLADATSPGALTDDIVAWVNLERPRSLAATQHALLTGELTPDETADLERLYDWLS